MPVRIMHRSLLTSFFIVLATLSSFKRDIKTSDKFAASVDSGYKITRFVQVATPRMHPRIRVGCKPDNVVTCLGRTQLCRRRRVSYAGDPKSRSPSSLKNVLRRPRFDEESTQAALDLLLE